MTLNDFTKLFSGDQDEKGYMKSKGFKLVKSSGAVSDFEEGYDIYKKGSGKDGRELTSWSNGRGVYYTYETASDSEITSLKSQLLKQGYKFSRAVLEKGNVKESCKYPGSSNDEEAIDFSIKTMPKNAKRPWVLYELTITQSNW